MRKCLGVLAGVAALCVLSWAQAPAPASPAPSAPTPQDTSSSSAPVANTGAILNFPRIEWFGGYSYGQTGFFNAGHWAGLNGWNASFGLNAASWIGLVVDGGEFYGTSRIPGAVPAPFPPSQTFCDTPGCTFNVSTREYNVLFGLQFPYRKYASWTPFGEVMFGHGSVRGIATPLSPGLDVTEIGSGLALLAGGGADHRINDRFALRLKADYLKTSAFKQKQDNFRFSVGIVIRSVHKKRRTLEEETPPEP